MSEIVRTVYVMAEVGNHAYCKIGKDSNWPFRFKQAHSHNPNQLEVVAAWHFNDISNADIIRIEAEAQIDLPKLSGTIVKEWYSVNPKEAIHILSNRFNRQPDESISPAVPIYNDWGEPNCFKNGKTYKSRIWIFSEDVKDYRIKVSHGILFDTNYRYNFTYNPRPVYLRYAVELPVTFGEPSPSLVNNNLIIQELWEQTTKIYGKGTFPR